MRNGFTQHTVESAPEDSKPILQGMQERYQMIPNIAAVMAESPTITNAYAQIAMVLGEDANLSSAEREVIFMTVSADNDCRYCMAAHSTMSGLDEDTLSALRENRPLPSTKLETLRQFARHVNATKGEISDEDIENFLAVGFTREQIFEVVTAIALKTLTNFTNHIAQTNLDEVFKPQAWKKEL
ncbi:carboxymuconolactone decarboxylase family protein [Candidatus Uabimicrobium sp. HlEnr_7]|uniref:carboxymuconolactone decarboxylase family protein n=1 Tax=Candidatus Uabimicrobium helgolandensis TaxID=3095367 RepID=UPI0035589731